MQKSRFAAALVLASMAGLAAVPPATVQTQTEMRAPTGRLNTTQAPSQAPAPKSAADQFSGWGRSGSRGSQRRRGPGWTTAHVKRMAHKRRNVARNRAAHR